VIRLLPLVAAAAFGCVACAGPAERGQTLYAEHGCAVCHGADGHGNGPSATRLDLPPRDFADPRAYRQGSSPIEIARSIRRGAGAMPPFRDITEEEANEIALWIVSRQRSSESANSPRR
jgi:mono/diheme cytochrome c family protein